MDNEDEAKLVPTISSAERYRMDLERQILGNQLGLIEKRLNQLFAALPDRSSVEISKENITTIMNAMVRVASKENMLVISERLGKVESLAESISRTSIYSEKDVLHLKEGQASIRETVFRETERVKEDLNKQTESLKGSVDLQTRDLKTDLDLQTTALKADLGAQTKDLKTEFDTQTKELVKQLTDLKVEVERSRTDSARWLLGTILVIITAIVGAATFFYRTIPERSSAAAPSLAPTVAPTPTSSMPNK